MAFGIYSALIAACLRQTSRGVLIKDCPLQTCIPTSKQRVKMIIFINMQLRKAARHYKISPFLTVGCLRQMRRDVLLKDFSLQTYIPASKYLKYDNF